MPKKTTLDIDSIISRIDSLIQDSISRIEKNFDLKIDFLTRTVNELREDISEIKEELKNVNGKVSKSISDIKVIDERTENVKCLEKTVESIKVYSGIVSLIISALISSSIYVLFRSIK